MLIKKGVKLFGTCLISIFLISCGSGEESDGGIEGSGQTALELKGTVAIGAPIANSDVVIKDKNGKKYTTLTDANGKYNATLEGMKPPFILKAIRKEKPALYSVAMKEGVANIHPLSDFVIRNWYGVEGRNIEAEFDNNTADSNPPEESEINSITQSVQNIFATVYTQLGISEEFNLLTSEFDADSTGFDKLLDLTIVVNQQNNITINIIDPVTQIQTTLIEGFNLSADIAAVDEQPPTRPEFVNVVAASDNTIILTWTSSTDNISIAGYNVYKGDVQVATVAFPTFVDGNLMASTRHCYKVEAFDGSGNKSTKTLENCAETLSTSDNTPPASVTNLEIKDKTDNSLKLSWSAVNDNDVSAYRIYREIDGTSSAIASVVSTQFVDLGLQAETNYCYLVKAFDAADNESEQLQSVCASTLPISQLSAPETVTGFKASPSSDSSIKLEWTAIPDESALNGYRIYRKNGEQVMEKIATVESEVFADQQLQIDSQYCYVIKTVDIAGIESDPTDEKCVNTLAPGDNTPPNTISDLNFPAITSSTISLSWTAVDDEDVMGYLVYRKLKDTVDLKKIAMVYEPTFRDFGLTANTEYCYEIRAIDASDNIALPSNQACALTAPNEILPPDTEAFPKGGDFTTVTQVWLACFDRGGSNCANTYYTLDGTEPDINSLVYSEALEIIETTTLRFFSVDNNGLAGAVQQEDYTVTLPQSGKPFTIATPNGGTFPYATKVWLNCFDNQSAGCADTYYTLDGSDPTTNSAVYGDVITIGQNSTLKFASVDHTGEMEDVRSETYTINKTEPVLEIMQADSRGNVVSDVGGIDCGIACSYLYDQDAEIVLTATHEQGLTAIWSGCEVIEDNKCKIVMNHARRVIVNYVSNVNESESNDGFADAQMVFNGTVVTGYISATDDSDFFKFDVAARGTLKVNLAHPSLQHYIYLYDANLQLITNTGRSTAPVITRSLANGTYYVQVVSYNGGYDLNVPYSLSFSGSVFGAPLTTDSYEENDSFTTATAIDTASTFEAYMDTSNDSDIFKFDVAARGTFKVNLAHPSLQHYIHLYDANLQLITNTGRSTAPVITHSLATGTYYARVVSYNSGYDLNVPYSLSFSGSVFGAPLTTDSYEENDSFTTATIIDAEGVIEAYMDTSNDADFFKFDVAAQGTFEISLVHPSLQHYIHLYDVNQQLITNTGRSTVPSLTQSLALGSYFIRIVSYNGGYDLNVPYTVSIAQQ